MVSTSNLNILDLNDDCIEHILCMCPMDDRVKVRLACCHFNDIFPFTFGHVKFLREVVADSSSHRSLAKFLIKYTGKYLQHTCMKLVEKNTAFVLPLIGLKCSRLTVLCLKNETTYSYKQVNHDKLMGEIFYNNRKLNRNFISGFNLSGECFGKLHSPEIIKYLKIVNCHGLHSDLVKNFLVKIRQLEVFVNRRYSTM